MNIKKKREHWNIIRKNEVKNLFFLKEKNFLAY